MQNIWAERLALSIVVTLIATSALASPGELDVTFDFDGKIITDFFGGTDIGSNLVVDTEGKILIGGAASTSSINDNFALARYNNDGTLDATFGKQGKVTTNKIADNTFVDDGIDGFGLQSSGKIIACGRARQGLNAGMALLRYHNNGSIDDSFGSGGHVFTPDASEENQPLALAIDESNRIIVVAAAFTKDFTSSLFAVFRYHADGMPDETFGLHGKVTTRITAGTNVPRAVKVDNNGLIVVGGFSGHSKFVVARYNTNGTLDTSFGIAGIATIYFNNNGVDTLNALALQPDGKIVVGGDVQVGSIGGLRSVDFGLARLNSNGQLDTSFNHTGKQITYFVQPAASSLWALAVQDDGKIVAVGDASIVKALGVARYNTDGTLDESFGEQGKQVTIFGRTCHWEGVALQQDGKIVAGGYVWNKKHYDMALARYHN